MNLNFNFDIRKKEVLKKHITYVQSGIMKWNNNPKYVKSLILWPDMGI